MGDQCLGSEVVVERDCLDELLDTATDLALVAPGFDANEVGDNGGKVLVDLFETGVVLFCDIRWDGLVCSADTLQSEDSAFGRKQLVRC